MNTGGRRGPRRSISAGGVRWALITTVYAVSVGCANDVVLGEHIATASLTAEAEDETSQPIATSSNPTNTSTSHQFPPHDGGKPPFDNGDPNWDDDGPDKDDPNQDDGPRPRPDSGYLNPHFDGGLPDAGRWPPLPLDPHPDETGPFDPRPPNSADSWPSSAPPNGASSPE